MSCEHIPNKKSITNFDEKSKIKKCCNCEELGEFVCVQCHVGVCEKCKDQHEHPILVGTATGYCNKCKKEFPTSELEDFWKSLPAFLPRNSKGVGLFLKHKTPKKIVILAGAGISTAAGIPDFRTPGTGLYDNLEKFNLPYPEAVFTLDYFDNNPQPFFTLATELMPGLGKYFPTVTHYFTDFLVEKGIVLKYFTQNIDGLEVQAGIPMDKLVLAHGHYYTGHCRKCKKEFEQKDFMDDIREGKIAYCQCGGVIKPDIVFFGENLPDEFFLGVNLLEDADFMICMGTSLTVQPFASLIHGVEKDCPRIFLNLTDAGSFRRKNDCKILQKTDDTVFEIVDYWGVGDEFRKFLDEKRANEKPAE